MTTKTAWIHPNALLSSFVILPDGYQIDRKDAEAKGYTVTAWPDTERTATPHPHEADKVVLARGTIVAKETAEENGFELGRAVETPVSGLSTWQTAINYLPDAQERPAAVAELLSSRTPETMTVDAARSFLRGLPVETTEEDTNDDPRAARLAEINASMKAFNKSMGWGTNAAKRAARPNAKAVDPTRVKRLAEIRLNALQTNGKGLSQEAKALRLALNTHSTVGTPLSQAMAQLGIDVSTLSNA